MNVNGSMKTRGSMRRLRGTLLLLAALAGAPAALSAQQPPAPADPLASLFTPELIMQHRRAIELTDGQRDQITRMIGELQGRVTQLQWELLDEMEQLERILNGPRVDLDRSLDQMERVLDREAQIKRAHLEMLVRIKNLLRPEQQAELTRLKGAGG
jgi:Spy/CpxP family protein refolding chaperone